MRLPLAMFGSRVAWRVFARFLLASLLPLGALAALFLTQVGRTLEQRANDGLGDTTRAIGQVLLDKLLAASELLPNVAELDADANLGALGLAAARYESAERSATFGAPFATPPLPAELDRAKPTLAVLAGVRGLDVILARALAHGRVIGRVDPDYLSSAAVLASASTETCVFAGPLDGEPVFCTAPLSASARAQLIRAAGAASSGSFTWSDDREPWLAAYWELFITSRFEGKPWFVVVSAPRSVALESLSVFNRVAPQALVLSLLLIVLLSVSQIRRTLDPLGRLVAGTRRLAAQDFSARVDVAGNDEFGSLGRAMNDMAERLGKQFGTLTTLAEIDKLILSSDDIEEVLEAVMERASANFPGHGIRVLLTDADDERRGRIYCRVAPGGDREPLRRIELAEEHRCALLAQPEGQLFAVQSPIAALFAAPAGAVADVFAVPILRGRTLGGALVTTLPTESRLDERDVVSLRELAGRLAVAMASTEREKALFHRAHFDHLTGMPNRQLCHDRLRQALAQARHEEHRVAVLFIDLDGFKNINDSLGHVAGDDLLRETALRLGTAVRDTDTIGRFGGDEYVVILPQVQSPIEVEAVIARVMAALQRPFVLHGRESFVSGSIGVTMFPEDGATAEELLRKADTAMYSAKASGRACCVYFTKEMDLRVQERLALSGDLRRAIDKGELYLVYQPQVALGTEEIVSAEALLRWRHPTRGLVSPDLFVPIMEEDGLIESVGTWVLKTALHDFAAWRRAGLPILRVAVNVAARQLLAPGFVDTLTKSLREAGVGNDCLELELTETTLVQDFRAANSRLNELSAHGIRIAIDDFGTGYSSLGYLNELTFDALKIDRAFVVNLPAEKSVAIVKAIVAVAHALAKEVVAEGIEAGLQRLHLEKLGCDLAQGYLFSPPLEERAFVKWLEAAAGRSRSDRASEVA